MSGIDVDMLLKTSIVPVADQASLQPHKEFLKKYQKTTIKGWEKIHEHLRKILERCETMNKGCGKDNCKDKCYTSIHYEDLTITILGSITVDETLKILSQWEVSHSIGNHKLRVCALF